MKTFTKHQAARNSHLQEWWEALDNLQENHPQHLASLLDNGRLASWLDSKVDQYVQTMDRVRQTNEEKDLRYPESDLQEVVRSETIAAPNPDWQDQQPLTSDQETKLQRFKQSHQQQNRTREE